VAKLPDRPRPAAVRKDAARAPIVVADAAPPRAAAEATAAKRKAGDPFLPKAKKTEPEAAHGAAAGKPGKVQMKLNFDPVPAASAPPASAPAPAATMSEDDSHRAVVVLDVRCVRVLRRGEMG
jgi:hypothetical protein